MCAEQSAYIQDLNGSKLSFKSNEEFTIGRALNRSITIEDLRISRTHCRFKEINGIWNVIDESVNGTIVNGNRIQPKEFHVLSNGDVIKITDDIQFTYFEATPNINIMEVYDIVDKIETDHHGNTRSNGPLDNPLSENVTNEGTNTQEKVGDLQDKEDVGEASNIPKRAIEPVSEKVESELQCSICTELFVKAQTLNCSHTFCNSCIEAWKRKRFACPICRAKIQTITPTIVLDNLVNAVIEASSEEIKKNRELLLKDREKLSKKRSKSESKFKRRGAARTDAGRGGTNSAGATRNLRSSTRGSTAIQHAPPEAIWISSSESDEFSSFDYDMESEAEIMNVLSHVDDLLDDTDDDDDSMPSDVHGHQHDLAAAYIPGNPEVYYGGYGTCFRCGARGHWANGCPIR